MGEVVQMTEVAPRQIQRTYKGQAITITYFPPTKTWKWEVVYISRSRFGGEAKTRMAAVKEAEKFIDKTNKIRGKE